MTESTTTPAHLTAEMSLTPLIKAWRLYLEDQGRSPHTIKAFTGDLRLLANYLPPDTPVGRISTDDLNRFMDWVKEGRGVPCSPKTCARRITSLKAFFKWLTEGGVLLANPAERLVQHSVLSPLPEVLSPAEVQALIETAEARRVGPPADARPYVLLSLLLGTGIKKSETVNIHLNHLALDEPEPYLFVRYSTPQHRYRERKIPLPPGWIEAFQEYRTQYSLRDRLFPWTARRLEYLLEELGEAAGLEKHVSFSMCRWTSALMDLRAGMEPNAIRQKLGVSKMQWRELYNKLQRLDAMTPRTAEPEPTPTEGAQADAENQTP